MLEEYDFMYKNIQPTPLNITAFILDEGDSYLQYGKYVKYENNIDILEKCINTEKEKIRL